MESLHATSFLHLSLAVVKVRQRLVHPSTRAVSCWACTDAHLPEIVSTAVSYLLNKCISEPSAHQAKCSCVCSPSACVQGGQMQPIDLIVETKFHRAAPGGMGSTKCAGNYSPVLLTQLEAKKQGFADVVYLDAQTNTRLEEVSSCNIFTVKGDLVKTPPLKGTILPGTTQPGCIRDPPLWWIANAHPSSAKCQTCCIVSIVANPAIFSWILMVVSVCTKSQALQGFRHDC